MSTVSAHYQSLENRLIFVTGGASGIGANIVHHLAAQNAKVAFIDIEEEDAQLVQETLLRQGLRSPWFRKVDVSDISALESAITEAVSECQLPLHGLINNAARDTRHKFEEVTPQYWEEALAINLRPHFFAMQTAAKFMVAGSSIINMGSVSWKRRRKGMIGYTTSKGAIHALTRSMAQELGEQGIRVNSVVPGAILTQRQEKLWLSPELEAEFLREQALKFRLTPDDVTAMVLFLMAQDSRGCSGQDFIVDGGIV